MAALIGIHVYLRNSSLEALVSGISWQTRAAVLTVLMLTVCLLPGDERAFIYFQF